MSAVNLNANSLGSVKIVSDNLLHPTDGRYLTRASADDLYLTRAEADRLYYPKGEITFTDITCDNITTTEGDRYLTKEEADSLYQSLLNPAYYDWTPNLEAKIYFTLDTTFTCPCNGWFICNPEKYDRPEDWSIYVNDVELFTCDDEGQITVQILLAKNDVITSSTALTGREAFFLAVGSALNDLIDPEEPVGPEWGTYLADPWDICPNAISIIEGVVHIEPQYIPDASTWRATWCTTSGNSYGKNFSAQIYSVKNGICYDSNNTKLFIAETKYVKNAENLFSNTTITSFTEDFSNLENGRQTFDMASNLSIFLPKNDDLSSLKIAQKMFSNCPQIPNWSIKLPNVEDTRGMFQYNTTMTTWTVDLPKVTQMRNMFFSQNMNSALETFTAACPKAWDCYQTFNGCNSLVTITADFSSLTNGVGMCQGCSSLSSFNATLPSLEDGERMFSNCRLDAQSVINILTSIPTGTGRILQLGVSKEGFIAAQNILGEITLTPEAGYPQNGVAGNISYKGWSIGIWVAYYFS